MPLGDFVEAGTTPKPLRIGRTLRFVFGVGGLAFFVWNFVHFSDLVATETLNVGYLVGAAFAWWYLSDAFVVGFGFPWGRWPQIVAITAAVALLMVGVAIEGIAWGTPLQAGLFVMTQFWFGFSGLSFIFAALFAVPG